ncbi:hypothetical protein G7046_g9750 [Stylonectria norvegica]|nr:hypothetical protein G7046_g9750 [Stylonectria norvegica]
MCRHHSEKTFCGVTADFYRQRLRIQKRFRIFLCEATRNDIQSVISNPRHGLSTKGLARRCGLHFGGDLFGRILMSKFKTQVDFLVKLLRRSQVAALGPGFRPPQLSIPKNSLAFEGRPMTTATSSRDTFATAITNDLQASDDSKALEHLAQQFGTALVLQQLE